MIKKERYKCEYCGTWHDTEEDAKKCEKWHTKVTIVENVLYDHQSSRYPSRIGVRIDDGAFIVYGKISE